MKTLKLTFAILVFSIVIVSCGNDPSSYRVEGTIENAPNTSLILFASGDPRPVLLDSVTTDERGHFVMTHHQTRPFNMYIYKQTGEWYVDLIGELADINIMATLEDETLKNIQVRGGKNNSLKEKFQTLSQAYVDTLNSIDQLLEDGEESSADEQDRFNEVLQKYLSLAKDFVLEQEVSFYTFSMMSSMLQNMENMDEQKAMIKKFGTTYSYAPEYAVVEAMAKRFAELEKMPPLPNVKVENLDGVTHDLFDLKGEKYTVIDFWATWCTPCIKELPHIAELYDEFDAKGVSFVSYNLDENSTMWKIKGDDLGISWHNVSENKGFDSDLSKFLSISSIPFLVVVDSQMKVVTKFLGFGSSDRVKQFLETKL